MERETHINRRPWAILAALALATAVGCANSPQSSAPAAPPAPVVRARPTSALVFESPYVFARHDDHGVARLDDRPEFDRRAASLSARTEWPVLATRQWPEPYRPRETRIPYIYSRWGRTD